MYTKATLVGLAAFISLASAAPVEIRQTGIIAKEFSKGGCRDILFAWARGSTEPGNMGIIVGPQTSDGLKQNFGAGAVATEGIDYIAGLTPNLLIGGTLPLSDLMMTKVLNDMAARCPDSVIVTGGYSQGGAVNHRAIEDLAPAVKEQIAGVVLYGDSQRVQDNNRIPNFPANKVLQICQPGDLICQGTDIVLPPHLTYTVRVPEGVAFLTQKIRGAQAKIKARNAKRAVEEAAKAAVEEVAEMI